MVTHWGVTFAQKEEESQQESLDRLEKELWETTGKKPKGMGTKIKKQKTNSHAFQKLMPEGAPAHAQNANKKKKRVRQD